MYTHVCVHVHTGHVTWSVSTLGVVAAVNGCVWVCCNGYAMTPALSRSVSQRTGWRSRAICPLVFPLVWILLAVPPQCHLGCSCPLWEAEKMAAESRDLLLRSFILVSLLFILGELYLYIRYILSYPPIPHSSNSSRTLLPDMHPSQLYVVSLRSFLFGQYRMYSHWEPCDRGGRTRSLPFWFSLGFNDLGHRRPLEASSVWVLV